MTLTEMQTLVMGYTGRSDQADLILQVLKAFTDKAHRLDFFPKDRKEATLNVTTAGTFITEPLPTRWRKFAYIFPVDSTDAIISGHKGFQVVDPEDIFTFERVQRNEVYYVVGENVRIKSYNTISRVTWCWYEYPALTSGAVETWMTLVPSMAQAIMDGATWYLNNKLGNSRMAQFDLSMWREWQEMIQAECFREAV